MPLKSYDDGKTHRATVSKLIYPNQVFTLEEINRFFNGKNGNPTYVVVNGLVFDITDRLNDFYEEFGYIDEVKTEINDCHLGKVKMLVNETNLVGYIKHKKSKKMKEFSLIFLLFYNDPSDE